MFCMYISLQEEVCDQTEYIYIHSAILWYQSSPLQVLVAVHRRFDTSVCFDNKESITGLNNDHYQVKNMAGDDTSTGV